MKYPAYPEYKESGVQWLGKMPEHWEVKRLKHITTINDDILPETTAPDFRFFYVDISSVHPVSGITNMEPQIFENAPTRARRKVQPKDTIVSTVRTYLRAITPIPETHIPIIVSTGFAVIRPKKLYSGFLAYALREFSFIENVVSRSTGVSYPAVNPTDIGDISILQPSKDEQTAIAAFLDRETGRLDQLMAKKRRLIALLKEKRIALISRTVTRGLPEDAAHEFGIEPHTRFKDSGIEWLGQVPEGWEALPLRRLVKNVKTGTTPNGAKEYHFEEGGFNWFTPSDFSDAIYLDTAKRTLSKEGRTEVRSFPKMTVMLVGIGATIGKVGLSTKECSCNQQINAIICNNKLTPIFATYILKTMGNFIMECGKFTTMPIINQDETKNLFITVPPTPEQTAIAAYLDRETAKIDQLIEKIETAITRLQEYRTALITAAVTGKIDIRRAV